MMDLHPYQEEGARWLASKNVGLLADEMGLGKSAQAIRALDYIKARRVLVVCPAVARLNWQREFAKFSLSSMTPNVISTRKFAITSPTSWIVSYDCLLTARHESAGIFDALILDEAHYLKSRVAERTLAVFHNKRGWARKAKRIWALTGTPMPNHAAELWVLMRAFGATDLTLTRWQDEFCTFTTRKWASGPPVRQVSGNQPDMLPELKRQVGKIMLRRTKADVALQLPPLSINMVPIPIEDPKGMPEDEAAAADVALELGANPPPLPTLRRWLGMEKAAPVARMVFEELHEKAYDKIVVFAWHTDVIAVLAKELKRFGVVVIEGATPPAKRQQAIDGFQNDAKIRVAVCQLQAAGTAINLTAASEVMLVEQDWVPANNAQAIMRCHRIGQDRPVNVRIAAAADTVDERIAAVVERKTKDINLVFN